MCAYRCSSYCGFDPCSAYNIHVGECLRAAGGVFGPTGAGKEEVLRDCWVRALVPQ